MDSKNLLAKMLDETGDKLMVMQNIADSYFFAVSEKGRIFHVWFTHEAGFEGMVREITLHEWSEDEAKETGDRMKARHAAQQQAEAGQRAAQQAAQDRAGAAARTGLAVPKGPMLVVPEPGEMA